MQPTFTVLFGTSDLDQGGSGLKFEPMLDDTHTVDLRLISISHLNIIL